MAIRLHLRKEQLEDLAILRDLGSETLRAAVDALEKVERPIRHEALEGPLRSVLPEQSDVNRFLAHLFSLYTLQRLRDLKPNEVLEGLQYAIERLTEEQRWAPDKMELWRKIQPELCDLLSVRNVMTVTKALELAFEYANILQTTHIITDIRPIFDAEATAILGAVVSYTLRLYYDNTEGNHSISIALDHEDLEKLTYQCDRAMKKARKAKSAISAHLKWPATIAGENADAQS